MREADSMMQMAERDLVQLWRGTTRRRRASARRHAPQMGQVPPARRVVIKESAEHI